MAEDGSGWVVERVLPRRSRFAREAAFGGRPQVVAANVDVVVALLPLADPEPSPRLADRVLVAAAAEGVEGVVLVAKTDLATEAARDDLLGLYRGAGIPVVAVSAARGDGVEDVAALLRGRTSVLVGPSGAGKSTLLRSLLGDAGAAIRTGAVNRRTGKGRHTTTASTLLPFPGGGWVVDTPGVRTLAIPDLPEADLARLFPDLDRLRPCRFQDCSHTVEPACAASLAVAEGRLDGRRLESYRALLATHREAKERRGYGA